MNRSSRYFDYTSCERGYGEKIAEGYKTGLIRAIKDLYKKRKEGRV